MNYHGSRFQYDPRREVLWKALWDYYFKKLIQPQFHVLELGAGYGHFINNVRAARRTAIDVAPVIERYAAQGVVVKVGSVTDLSFLEDASVDVAFASNVFEHLTQAEFAETLTHLRRKLGPGGMLVILQPNYRRAYKEYFDDYTHITVYSDVSLCDFLVAHGYRILECRPGFMPFSLVSRLPVWRWLIWIYLMLPWKPFAKQMLVRATPAPSFSDRG